MPPGVVHAFSNQIGEPARFLVFVLPGEFEAYFDHLSELIRNEPSWPPAYMGKVSALMAKYDLYSP